MRPPAFWKHKHGTLSAPLSRTLLMPFSWLVIAAGRWRTRLVKPIHASMPVICVGNVTMGGTGKTPFCIAVAKLLIENGYKPAFLTRGYGGKIRGPMLVDAGRHSGNEVGDEALLLARCAPTIVARDRVAGAHEIAQYDANIIIMDDGFQNPYLAKDFCFLVRGGKDDLGNEKVFPAGPLREPLSDALRRTSALVSIAADIQADIPGLPVLSASLANPYPVPRGPLFAFAGIGNPDKFFFALKLGGAKLVQEIPFADHHRYSTGEIAKLHEWAKDEGAQLITTEKDFVRLPENLRNGIIAWPVEVRFKAAQLIALLAPILEQVKQ